MKVKVYRYDEYGIFTCEEEALIDPLESELSGQSFYLLPANATFEAPPAIDAGYVAVWTGTAWEQVQDNRGVEYWLPGDTHNTQNRIMTVVGPLPSGARLARPEPSLSESKVAKLLEIKNWTAAAITGGFISAGVRYDSDTDTQITMQGICLAVDTPRFTEEYPQGCPVRGYDEGSTEKAIHMLDAAGVKAFCADMSAHIGTCKQKGWQLQQAVAAAETVEDVEKITWPEG